MLLQYRLSCFQEKDTKLEHNQRKLLCFENRYSAKPSINRHKEEQGGGTVEWLFMLTFFTFVDHLPRFLVFSLQFLHFVLSWLCIILEKYSVKAVTSVRSPKMKRDASVKVVFFLSKKTTFTEASLFIFGQRTDVMALYKFYVCYDSP